MSNQPTGQQISIIWYQPMAPGFDYDNHVFPVNGIAEHIQPLYEKFKHAHSIDGVLEIFDRTEEDRHFDIVRFEPPDIDYNREIPTAYDANVIIREILMNVVELDKYNREEGESL